MRKLPRSVPLLLAVLALAAGACSSSSKSGTGGAPSATTPATSELVSNLPSAIQASKKINVGSDIEHAPIEFYKEGTTKVEGVDPDRALAMGKKLGVTFHFIDDTDFAGIIGALNAGRFDIIMSA